MTPNDLLIDMFPKRFPGPRYIECRSGWSKLILEFLLELSVIDPEDRVTFFSIKEKFGMLRIDINEYPEDIYKRVSDLETEYEKRSMTICEECGKPGRHRGGSWFRTVCDEHA